MARPGELCMVVRRLSLLSPLHGGWKLPCPNCLSHLCIKRDISALSQRSSGQSSSPRNSLSKHFPHSLCLLTLLVLPLWSHRPLSNPGGSIHLNCPPLHDNGIQQRTISLLPRLQVSYSVHISFINMFLQLFQPFSHRVSITPRPVLSCHPQIIEHSRPKSLRSPFRTSLYPRSRMANRLGFQIPGT